MTAIHDRLAAALPQYDIGTEIGRGASGVVLSGEHRQLRRSVAIKELSASFVADPSVRRRFATEARLLASLDHPHIVPIFDYVENDHSCLLVMELCPQGSVWDRFDAVGVRPDAACAITLATCSALHYAHGKGILHRDIKPENLLFNAVGTLRVTDFGIAKMLGGGSTADTATGEILGTPSYMSPEQVTGGELSPATDIYSVGTLLYEMLSGRLPFLDDGNLMAVLYRHVHDQPAPLRGVAPQVPRALADVVMRALATDPAERYPGAEDFGVALADAALTSWGAGWVLATGLDVVASRRVAERISGGHPPVWGAQPASPIAQRPRPAAEPVPTALPVPAFIGIPPPPGFTDPRVPAPPPVTPATPTVPEAPDPVSGGQGRRGRKRSSNPGRRRWIIGGAAAAVVVVIAAVAVVVTQSGGGSHRTTSEPTSVAPSSAATLPSTTATVAPTTQPPTTSAVPGPQVFADSFSDATSGWAPDANQVGVGTGSYEADGYHVRVLKGLGPLSTFSVGSPDRTRLPSIAVQVDASFVTAAAVDGVGVRCDQGGRAGVRYTFQIDNNQTWSIFELGSSSIKLAGGTNPVIHTGGAENTLVGLCRETSPGVTQLIMSVNSQQLSSISDNRPPGPYLWHGALTVYRDAHSPATEVRFNNYRLYRPAD